MAYITGDDNYVGSYGYHDYKVAHYSIDYYAWTSGLQIIGRKLVCKGYLWES